MLCCRLPCCRGCRRSRLFRAADIVGRVYGAERANLALRRSALTRVLNLTADSTTHLAAVTITVRRNCVRNCRYAFPAGTLCCGRRTQAIGSGNRRSIIDLYCTAKTVSVTDRRLPRVAKASSQLLRRPDLVLRVTVVSSIRRARELQLLHADPRGCAIEYFRHAWSTKMELGPPRNLLAWRNHLPTSVLRLHLGVHQKYAGL